MGKRYLLLDCDGVIFNSNALIDKEVQKINLCASDKYCEMLNSLSAQYQSRLHDLEMERANNLGIAKQLEQDIEDLERRREAHFLFKDMVLEEVLPEYRGRIDYDKIFQLHNAFPGVIKKIKEIYDTGIFDDIYIVSHYNSSREAAAKIRFFKKYLPMVKVILVKFHQDEFIVGDDEKNKLRQRTNKLLDFSLQTGITDFSLSAFIDDTSSIITEAESLGVGSCLYKGKRDRTIALLDTIFERMVCDIDIEISETTGNKKGNK